MSRINFLDIGESFNTIKRIKNVTTPLGEIDYSEKILNNQSNTKSKNLLLIY